MTAQRTMQIDSLWKRYAAIWELAPSARAEELLVCVTDDVTYCDPNTAIEGRDSLSGYMADFQEAVPGGAFRIGTVLCHHNRSLAQWTLCRPDGCAQQTGTSFAHLADDGRLQTIIGFFDLSQSGQPV